jgi:hypothetical protein
MPSHYDPWNSLEIVKLLVGALTPVSVVVLGWFVSRRLKRIELVQWSNQKLIEKRLQVYDSIAPLLNRLLCFFTWVGDWKDISPEELIRAKRELDKVVNVYRHLFEDEVYKAYQAYIHLLFKTFMGAGVDARIRSFIKSPDGDRTSHCSYVWKTEWSQKFYENEVPSKSEVRIQYHRLMGLLRNSLGVHE